MDQSTLFDRIEKMLRAYEETLQARYNLMQRDVLGILGDYYTKYGEHINDYTKFSRWQKLQKEINQTAQTHFNHIQSQLEQAASEVGSESYLLYAYLLYMTFGGEENGTLPFPVPETLATSSAVVALVFLLIKRSKSVWDDYTKDEHFDLAFILNKHRADYAYGVITDVQQNLRAGAGLKDASERVKKRTKRTKSYGMSRLHELIHDVVSYVQDKICDIANDPAQYVKKVQEKAKDIANDPTKHVPKKVKELGNRAANYLKDKVYDAAKDGFDVEKLWISMRDWRVRMAHRELDSTWSKDGWFYYGGDKARRPKGFLVRQELNYGCRCKLFLSFNEQIPRASNVYNYRDGAYMLKMDKRIAELEDDGYTYWQALKQADKEIKPPRQKRDTYITFEDWKEEYGRYS